MFDGGLVAVLALGFVLGMKHALDADHVIAVSTIVSKSHHVFGGTIVGAFWGLGHTLTLFLVGGVMLSLKVTIPHHVALMMEMAVGVMLVFIGGVVAAGLIKEQVDFHLHYHEGKSHFHPHKHSNIDPHDHQHAIQRGYRSMAVGMVHGLAGSAALMLLVVGTIGSTLDGILYIGLFGLGSILGMMMFTTLISLPFVYTAFRFSRFNRAITGLASFTSIILGTVIIYEIGFVRGLF